MLADKVNAAPKSSILAKSRTDDFVSVFNQSKAKISQQAGYSAKRDVGAYSTSNSAESKFERMKKTELSTNSSQVKKNESRHDKVEDKKEKKNDNKKTYVNDELLAYLAQITGISKQDIQSMLNENTEADQNVETDKVFQFLSQATGIDMEKIKALLAKGSMDSNETVESMSTTLEGESLNSIEQNVSEKASEAEDGSELPVQMINNQTSNNNETINKLASFLSQATGIDVNKVEAFLNGELSDNNDQAVAKIANFLSQSTGISSEEMLSMLVNLQDVNTDGDDRQAQGIVFGEKLQNAEKLLDAVQQNTQIPDQDKQALIKKLDVFVKKLSIEIDKAGANDPHIQEMADNLTQQISQAQIQVTKAAEAGMNTQEAKAPTEEITPIREKRELSTSDRLPAEQSEGEASEIQIMTSTNDTKDQSNGEETESKEFASSKIIKISDLQTGKLEQQAPFQQIYGTTIAEKNDVGFSQEVLKKSINQPIFNNEEVFKQVVEHAKVTLTADKSEMIMHLTPESLGKLTMKVVTEKGLMVAQFTAESQQVKQIIEANLPQLKDALESQGLNVQGFSVSVGQEGAQKQQYERNSAPKTRRVSGVQGNTVLAAAGYDTGYPINNPYKYSDSSVEFQA